VKKTFRTDRITGWAVLMVVVASIAATSISMAKPALDAAVSCESLKTLSLANTVVDNASVAPASKIGAGPGSPATQAPATCRVQ